MTQTWNFTLYHYLFSYNRSFSPIIPSPIRSTYFLSSLLYQLTKLSYCFRNASLAFLSPHSFYHLSFALYFSQYSFACKSVLSSKVEKKAILVVEDFVLPQAKTKAYKEVLKNLELDNRKTLHLIVGEWNGLE